MKNRVFHLLLSCVALALCACLPALSQNGPEITTADDPVVCERTGIPVSLASGQPANYIVNGQLCATEDELSSGTTVQLLIHGATYNRDYWDFGKVDGVAYSYARDVAAAGFPTFALDEIGAGKSSHPPSDKITVQSAAYVAHQIVQGLRSGSISGIPFGKVIIVGHSLGSTAVWEEAITYGDVDGVIVTGAAHSVTTQFLNANALYPAVDDPKFANSGLDSGYLTTKPGVRSTLFYRAPDYDPAIIARDEARKDLVPAAYLSTGITLVTSNATQAIQVPVLTLLGGNDFTTCGLNPQGGNFDCSSGTAVATQEAPLYSSQARIHGCIIPGSGHDVNLAVNHNLAVADTVAWSFAFVGQRSLDSNHAFDRSNRGLQWNDRLPWNCGSAQQQ